MARRMTESEVREIARRLGPRAVEAYERAPRVVIPPGAMTRPQAAAELPRAPERKRHAGLTPGEVILRIEIPGPLVPWRTIGMTAGRARKPQHVKAWQQKVALAVHDAGFGEAAGVAPYHGPVSVRFWLCRKAPDGFKPGDVWDARPDGDNLGKALKDAVSGNAFKSQRESPPHPTGRVIVDDNLVVESRFQKLYWSRHLAFIEIVAVDKTLSGPFPFDL